MERKRVLIMGAAGRDFHNFNVLFRDSSSFEVCAFTAAQIPFIDERVYPPELAGSRYPRGIPVFSEGRLAELIGSESIDEVVFSYSDISYADLMSRASIVNAAGASFVLPAPQATMLPSSRPVIAVTAVRTGCGKSAVTRYIASLARGRGLRAIAVRHPMPYGELTGERAVQRFASMEDMDRQGCTIEEMEEYEPLIEAGVVVYAGIDYEAVLRRAEGEADLIIWDGGNNDTPFFRPDLYITLADPLRPGHERSYYPGETNVRLADCVVMNKARSAKREDLEGLRRSIEALNPSAPIVETAFRLSVDGDLPRGTEVLVIEDGPTLTHGGMTRGAGMAASLQRGWVPVDPRPHAVGTLRETFGRYAHLKDLLPAMGYSADQVRELRETIEATPAEAVVVATPVDLGRFMEIRGRKVVRVRYELDDFHDRSLGRIVEAFLDERFPGGVL